jgi:hypothetical protein
VLDQFNRGHSLDVVNYKPELALFAVPDFLFVNYSRGATIHSSEEINLQELRKNIPDINADKGL